MRRHSGRDPLGQLGIFRLKIVDRIGEIFAALHPENQCHFLLAFVGGSEPFEIIQQRFPSRILEMHHHRLDSLIQRMSQFTHRQFFLSFMLRKPGGGIDRFRDGHPDTTPESGLVLEVQAKRHDPDRFVPVTHFISSLGDPCRPSLHLFHMHQIMTFSLGKNAHRQSLGQVLTGNIKRFDVSAHGRGRLVVLPAISRDHSDGPHDRTQHRRLEQRCLGQKTNRPVGRDPDDHRVDQRVGMVGNVKRRPLTRKPLRMADMDRGIVNANEPAHNFPQ